jgi:hypothetical protein
MAFDSGFIKKGELKGYRSTIHPMLISTLRTDTIDEDLICYNWFDGLDFNASTYIYKWIVNGKPLTEILMPFDTENINVTKDYSGNEYHGALKGPNWTDKGKIGGAYYFNGASDYIYIDLPISLKDIPNNDFTLSLWLKSDDITQDQRVVLQAGNKTEKNFIKIQQMYNQIHFGVCEDGTKRARRSDNISSNIWYHIAGVWDASENSLKLYVNGNISQKIGYRQYAMSIDQGFDIGHGSTSSRFWLGYIDELQLFDRALSDGQIYQIYMNPKDGLINKSVIVADETNFCDIWRCNIIPNDGTQDGTIVKSNTLEVTIHGGG